MVCILCSTIVKRWISALSWVAVTAVVLGLILGICYSKPLALPLLSCMSMFRQGPPQCLCVMSGLLNTTCLLILICVKTSVYWQFALFLIMSCVQACSVMLNIQ